MIGPNIVPLTTVTSCNTHNNNNFHHYHSNNNRINNIDTIQKNNNHAVLPIHQHQPEQQQGQSYQHNNRQPKNKRKLNKGISSTSTMTGTKSNKKSRLFNIIHNYSNENFDETISLLNNDKQNIFNNENIIIFDNGTLSNKEEIDYNTCLDLQTPQIQLDNNQQSQLSSDPEIKEIENSNLSWLLNFKVASLFDSTSSEDGNSSRRSSSEDDAKEEREDLMTVTSPDRPHKPPYTYTELIEQALKEKGELTVSGIYYWISERFPFYKVHDDRWKNSVRHNLSINPHFRKGMKASQGAGHLWTLSTQGVSPSPEVWKKNRVKHLINLMDEVAVATASIEEPSDPTTLEALSPQPSLPLTETSPDPSLARSAEEILSGVKKQVEVQYLTPDPDFLNHITKDEVIEEEESSLVTEVTNPPYLISDLGSEVILTDGLFCDDLNFQCCELTTTTNLT